MAGRPLRRARTQSLATFPATARNPLPVAKKTHALGRPVAAPLFRKGDIISYKDGSFLVVQVDASSSSPSYCMARARPDGSWHDTTTWRDAAKLAQAGATLQGAAADAAASFAAETKRAPAPKHQPMLGYGVVVIDDHGRVLLREPANHWGGYVWTFPKGGADPGEAGEEVALRELLEETGWTATLTLLLPEAFETHGQVNRYYLGTPGALVQGFDHETQSIGWFDEADARSRIMLTQPSTGRSRDLGVLCSAYRAWERTKRTRGTK